MKPRLRIRPIEPLSPVESLTVYRALVVCHVAGAVFVLLGLTLDAGAISEPFRTPTLVAAVVQLAASTALLIRPAPVPTLILSYPRATLAFSIAAAAFYLLPTVDPLGPPTVTVAFAWISTAAAVLPPRGWPTVGAAATVAVAAMWALSGLVGSGDPVVHGTVILGALGFLPGAVNAAWMGARGSLVARQIRRWGLVIGSEDGALSALRDDAEHVSQAAEELLTISGTQLGEDATIAVGTLRHAAVTVVDGDLRVVEHVRTIVAALHTAFEIVVSGDETAELSADSTRVLDDAIFRHLMNVAVHAPAATQVDIRANPGRGRLVVTIEDDGGGSPPAADREGEGTDISRSSLTAVNADLRYEAGSDGVRLVIDLPTDSPYSDLLPSLSSDLHAFISKCLRNNRLATYLSPIPFLAFGTTGLLWSVPVILLGGCAIEAAFHRAGTSDEGDDLRFLLIGAGIATALTGLFAVTLAGSDPFVPSAATAYPIIELAWRGRWGWWVVGELLRALLVGIWIKKAGPGGLGGAYVLPLALTLIAVGGHRLVKRAAQIEARVGDAVVRRRTAASIARRESLRHDVVTRLAGRTLTPEATAALAVLDEATKRLAAHEVPAVPVVDDVLTGLRAAAAPAPVHLTDARDRVGPDQPLKNALEMERRLNALEIGAAVGALTVSAVPPTWTGRQRLRALVAELSTDANGATRISVTAEGDHRVSRPADATDEVKALSAAGIHAVVSARSVEITIAAAPSHSLPSRPGVPA